MTQREFDSRVKGAPRATRGYVPGRRLRQAAQLLFGPALVIVLLANGDGLFSIRSTPVSEKTTRQTAVEAFGAAPMRAARGVVRRSGIAADSPMARSVNSGADVGVDVDGLFARALDGAIARMQALFAAAPVPDLHASVETLIDQARDAEQAFGARFDSLLPGSSDASSMSLDSDLPMLAGIGAFAALIALCFGAAIFITGKISRGSRARAVRYGPRRS